MPPEIEWLQFSAPSEEAERIWNAEAADAGVLLFYPLLEYPAPTPLFRTGDQRN